jgi:TRAP-type C4-dicarboxylate transport system permease small subunit
VLVTGLMLFLVIARYVLGLSIVGLHELILLSALQLYMVGAIIASRRGEHITVTWLGERIRAPRAQALHGALVAAITVVVTVFFLVWTYHMFAWGLKMPQSTPAYGIPLWILQVPIPVAAVACFLYALRDFVQSLIRFRAG